MSDPFTLPSLRQYAAWLADNTAGGVARLPFIARAAAAPGERRPLSDYSAAEVLSLAPVRDHVMGSLSEAESAYRETVPLAGRVAELSDEARAQDPSLIPLEWMAPGAPPVAKWLHGRRGGLRSFADVEKRVGPFVHGTSNKAAESIMREGAFNLDNARRHYDYSQLGPDAVYAAPKGSWWLDPEKAAAGRAASYETSIPVTMPEGSTVFVINNQNDVEKLAKLTGFKAHGGLTGGQRLVRWLDIDGLMDAPGERMGNHWIKSREATRRLREAGIESVYVSQGIPSKSGFDDLAGEQLGVLAPGKMTPKGAK